MSHKPGVNRQALTLVNTRALAHRKAIGRCREAAPLSALTGCHPIYCRLRVWHSGAHAARAFVWDDGARLVRRRRISRRY